MRTKPCSVDCESFRRNRHIETKIDALKEKVHRNLVFTHEYFGNPELSDFQIQAGGRTFYVSKYQLALKSKVFARMFMVDMKEKNEGVMRLDDDPDSVEAMLEFIYMYTGVEGAESARKVIQLAHRYDLAELKDQCELEIVENLTVEDAEESLLLASQLKLSLLFSKCNQILYFNFSHFEENSISMDCQKIWFDEDGDCITPVDLTNHSNTKMAVEIYSCDPLTRRMALQVIEPSSKRSLPRYSLRYKDCPDKTMGLVYYAPHIEGSADYYPVHLWPNSRFFSIEISFYR